MATFSVSMCVPSLFLSLLPSLAIRHFILDLRDSLLPQETQHHLAGGAATPDADEIAGLLDANPQ